MRLVTAILSFVSATLCICSCSRPAHFDKVEGYPDIFPDYIGVTVPEGIAEPVFRMADGRKFIKQEKRIGDTLFVTVKAWTEGSSVGNEYTPFPIYISSDSIDPYIAYRLIEPGYESWHEISLVQRELSSYKENAFVTNSAIGGGCINCHTFPSGDPSRMLFHARGKGGGTVFITGNEAVLTDLTAIGAGKQGTYPAWHPDGRYIAFSSNTTQQGFTFDDQQPIEVYDTASDIILMDTQTGQTVLPDIFNTAGVLETFPTWSSDGTMLYYCSADTAGSVLAHRKDIHYSLMGAEFKDGAFTGRTETIFSSDTLSISFPRAYGKYLLFTAASFGTFPIWHKEADLWLMDLSTGCAAPAGSLNSSDTESYHSWSSNGKWVLFSSRRLDGRYTRLYLAHFDMDGHFSKPFLLPQKDPDYNVLRLKSYNIPEFVKEEIPDMEKTVSELFGK